MGGTMRRLAMTSMVFRWRSWLGLAVALFLVYGAPNLLIAIAVPLTLQVGGAGALGVGDRALLPAHLGQLRRAGGAGDERTGVDRRVLGVSAGGVRRRTRRSQRDPRPAPPADLVARA